ncbi:MAG: hypothetical protein Q9172_000299 [Xanthocarpia lactea]
MSSSLASMTPTALVQHTVVSHKTEREATKSQKNHALGERDNILENSVTKYNAIVAEAPSVTDDPTKLKSSDLQYIRQNVRWPDARAPFEYGLVAPLGQWRNEMRIDLKRKDFMRTDNEGKRLLREHAVWHYIDCWLRKCSTLPKLGAQIDANTFEQYLRACMLRDNEEVMFNTLFDDASWEIDLYTPID